MKKWWNLFLYEVKNALVSMGRHWALCLSAVTTITLTLFLVAVFALTGTHVESFSRGIGQELAIHAVMTEGSDEAQALQLQQVMESMDNVRAVQYRSKEEELETMIAEKGDAFSIYRGDNNPLSPAFFIYLEDESLIEQTSAAIQALPEIESAVYGGTSVSSLVAMLQKIRLGAAILAGLLIVLSVYLIYNTIRSTIYSRQTEIAIMKTVGATSAFIRIPFILEGMILGALGALIPWLCIYFAYPPLYDYLGGRLFISEFALQPPGVILPGFALLLFGLGAGTGLLASALAAGKYLRKIR